MNLSLSPPQPSLSPSLPTTQDPNPQQPSKSPRSPIPNPNPNPKPSVGSTTSISYAKRRVLVRSSCSRIVQSVADSSALLGGADGDEEEKVVGEPSFWEFVGSERFKVVAMIAVALVLCNADRVVMSVAIVPLSLANGWRQSFAGIVQSSFLWGYLISPIAGGTLVDYYGGKKVLAWGVGLWSVATFLTPRAAETSLWALLAMRVLVGVAEGVALPCMNNMILRWFPKTERSRAVGLALAGFQLGNAIALMLSPVLMSWFGVFGPFIVFGLFGFLWVLLWLSNISSAPDQSQKLSRYELEYIRSNSTKSFMIASDSKNTRLIPPFRRLLSKMPTWSLIVANMMQSWVLDISMHMFPSASSTIFLIGDANIQCVIVIRRYSFTIFFILLVFSPFLTQGYFLFLSWMPIYFKTVYNVDIRQAAWFSAVPWSIMALVGYFAGAASDMLIKRGMSITLTRKIMQSIGFVGPAISLIGLTLARHPSTASAWLSLAVGLKSFSNLGFLVNLQEIAPQYSGVLHGMSNTAGSFAAIVGTIGTGYFVELVGSFQGFLLLTSFLYICATLFWNIFSTGERVNFD